jgi:hypothetical protein
MVHHATWLGPWPVPRCSVAGVAVLCKHETVTVTPVWGMSCCPDANRTTPKSRNQAKEKQESSENMHLPQFNRTRRLRCRYRSSDRKEKKAPRRVSCRQPQAQIQPFGGGFRDIVPAPSGMRAVGDGAARLVIEPGVPGCDAVVGEPTDATGVTGFIRRPLMQAGAGTTGFAEVAEGGGGAGDFGGGEGSNLSR